MWSRSEVGLSLAQLHWLTPKTSFWTCQSWIPGCYPHGRRKCWWRKGVENKAINVIGCLDRGQREDRRREGELAFKPFKCPLEGSRGCQICGAPQFWLLLYLPVLICVHPAISPVLYLQSTTVCLEEYIIAPQGFEYSHGTVCSVFRRTCDNMSVIPLRPASVSQRFFPITFFSWEI